MKRFSYIAVSFVFAAIFAVSVSAQAQPAGNPRIAVIDTSAFDAKDGLTRYINAQNALAAEFTPLETELKGLVTKFQTLGAEIKKLQDTVASGGTVPIGDAAIKAKIEEYQNLDLTIKRKQEDGKRKLESRQGAVLGPVMQDISKALQDFGTQKGYDLILDLSKLDSILAYNPAKTDVTKEFIAFFNTRPAGAATAATPR